MNRDSDNAPVEPRSSDDSNAMFSQASFGAVLDAQTSDETQPSTPIGARPVVAFYGFRGGSGRTTALAHIAATFAARGRTIVAIDLDLEAPGLATVFGAQSEDSFGSAALLRTAEQVEQSDDDRLRISPHLVSSTSGLPSVRIIPAGKPSATYCAALDLLNPSLWHVMDGPSPLHMLLKRIRVELEPDVIFIDCRTGLAPLAATALFHEADIVVACFSATRQSHDGARMLIETLRAAQTRRNGRPETLLVPTMFVETDEGLKRRNDLIDVFDSHISATRYVGSDENSDLVDDSIAVVADGVPFRTSLSVSDTITRNYEHIAGRAYEPLIAALDRLLGDSSTNQHITSLELEGFSPTVVLTQLSDELPRLAFAEDVEAEQIVRWFLEPAALRTILSNATFYIVGAKGSGKSWLYMRMIAGSPPLDPEQRFIRGHGPSEGQRQDEEFTVESLRAFDKKVGKRKGDFEATFWRLRAVATLLRIMSPSQVAAAFSIIPASQRRLFSSLSVSEDAVADAILKAFGSVDVETISEKLLQHIDQILSTTAQSRLVLVYDGLDTGFGSSPVDLQRRQRFVRGLVEALEAVRGRLRSISFKVMLREDVFAELDVQNKSHLRTATVELVWRPVDVWKLALSLAIRSEVYRRKVVGTLDPTISTTPWPDDEARLVRLLEPLWGAQMERGRTVLSKTFVRRRTADGRDRLFPRTLVEMLRSAVEYEIKRGSLPSDRVLTSAAMQEGYRAASRQRLVDLKAEYKDVSNYLEALAGMNPTATRTQLRTIMQNKMRKRDGTKKGAPGVKAGALHAGPGGWNKVVDRLLDIGVLKEYKRATGESGEPKYEIALLYRPALGVKLVGV